MTNVRRPTSATVIVGCIERSDDGAESAGRRFPS